MTTPVIRIVPHPLLAPYIECYWMLHLEAGQVPDRQQLPADGRIELMFSFASGSRRTAADGSDACEVQSCSFILGARTQGYTLEHFGAPHYVAVRLKPGGLSAFTRLPLIDLTDKYADLDCVWDIQAVRDLEDQLAGAGSPRMRAQILNDALLARLNPPDYLERLMLAVCKLGTLQADLTMPELAADMSISQKHFERLFARYIGFRPSLFARVTRFQQALYGTRRFTRHFTLGQMAAQLGYYDQSHFTKDFKHFSGSSPNNFFACQHEFVNISTPLQVVELLQDIA